MPDSITTWVTEAVSLSEEKGLGLARRSELRTFKNFFVDFTLPYSLIRGEQTKVPLTVYNYLPTCSEVTGSPSGRRPAASGVTAGKSEYRFMFVSSQYSASELCE